MGGEKKERELMSQTGEIQNMPLRSHPLISLDKKKKIKKISLSGWDRRLVVTVVRGS